MVRATAARRAKGKAGTSAGKLPMIRLGKLKVSRLILGSNPFFGFAHRGPKKLGQTMEAYFTDERIMEVLEAAAEEGITAVAAPCYERWIGLFSRYLDQGGRLRTWIAQPDDEPRRMRRAIAAAANGRAGAVFIQGARADDQFDRGGFRTLSGWLDHIHAFGLPAGLASHRADTHCEYERRGLPADFYFQCFYRPINERYARSDRDANVAALGRIDAKPVIGYKILAAGRVPPEQAFPYAFAHLRPKDGVCVGIYPPDNPAMLAQNATLTRTLPAAAGM